MAQEEYHDKDIQCTDCHEPFVWTAEEQEFYAERGFETPKRCRACRKRRKIQQQESAQASSGRSAPDFPHRGRH